MNDIEIIRATNRRNLDRKIDELFDDVKLKKRQIQGEPIPNALSLERQLGSKIVLAREALKTLSGDLSYDNVAAAKQILKIIID